VKHIRICKNDFREGFPYLFSPVCAGIPIINLAKAQRVFYLPCGTFLIPLTLSAYGGLALSLQVRGA